MHPATAHDYENAYLDIVKLYDIAEQLVETMEDPRALYQNDQVAIVEPLVEEVVECSDDLSENFCIFADAKNKQKAAKKFKFRNTFKRMFKAMNESLDSIYALPANMAENITCVMMSSYEQLVSHAEELFNKLVVLVEMVKEVVVKRRKELREMMMREGHIATMIQANQAASLNPPKV